MDKITDAYYSISKSHHFISELRSIRKHFQGRPTPVYYARTLSDELGGRIYLKREDLNHTGAHKLNHCMGEALLAKYMGKKKLIAETGAGQHGVALATAAAYFGLECEIHMGEVDIRKEHPNVIRMKLLGANVVPVTSGLKTLKEAVDSAFSAYLEDPVNSIYCIGSVVGPHPFPMMVRDFQRVVGIEAKEQFFEMTGEMPDNVVACVGGGSNSMGISRPSSTKRIPPSTVLSLPAVPCRRANMPQPCAMESPDSYTVSSAIFCRMIRGSRIPSIRLPAVSIIQVWGLSIRP